MNKSDSIKELATALAKAQAELKNPPFDSKNPHFRSNYASLASVRDTIMPVFARHGLSIIQNVRSSDKGVACTNLVLHQSGEWIETDPFEVPADKQNAHGYGSACTYARRFSLMALAAVVGDIDDDGNEAVSGLAKPIRITPNDGAGEDLTQDQRNRIADCATAITAAYVADNEALMFELYSEVSDNSEKLFLWSLLNSKVRSAIKRAGEARKAK